jgi:hypothetical protein
MNYVTPNKDTDRILFAMELTQISVKGINVEDNMKSPKIVVHLMKHLLHKWNSLSMDNFFSLLYLICILAS